MKPINKLNEDFFDDFSGNDLINEPDGVLIDDPDYTYNIQFIIYMYPFMRSINNVNKFEYYFEKPKYKPFVESGFLSIKKALDYILQASSIVTDYSEPKFCSSSERIIKTFPFMTNKKSNEFIVDNNQIDNIITLETSINLSGRKNVFNLTKLFYSFWRLQQIYDKLIIEHSFLYRSTAPYINIGIYKKNPYKKSIIYELLPSDVALTSTGLELINFLNSKDETEQ